jgi:DnaJ-domain-containing protein 1
MAKRKKLNPMQWFDNLLDDFLDHIEDGLDDLSQEVENVMRRQTNPNQSPFPPPPSRKKAVRRPRPAQHHPPAPKQHPTTLYDVLEVSPKASYETIEAAYRSLCKRFHPDRHPGNKQAEEKMKMVNVAWSTLSKPEKRHQYDLEMRLSTVRGFR